MVNSGGMEEQINLVFARLNDIAHSIQSLAVNGLDVAESPRQGGYSKSPTLGVRGADCDGSPDDDLTAVKTLIRTRRMRATYFEEDLFFDPTWSMLIDMYHSKLNGERLSVSDVCLGSGVASTTALRYIALLEERGYVERVADPKDKRRVFLHLTPTAVTRLRGYFGSVRPYCSDPQTRR